LYFAKFAQKIYSQKFIHTNKKFTTNLKKHLDVNFFALCIYNGSFIICPNISKIVHRKQKIFYAEIEEKKNWMFRMNEIKTVECAVIVLMINYLY
jgi:hypothetical protein